MVGSVPMNGLALARSESPDEPMRDHGGGGVTDRKINAHRAAGLLLP